MCINHNNSGTIYYDKIKAYLKKYNIYYIDFSSYLTFSNELIRDDVHTTELGSKKYANIISELFLKDKDKIIVPNIILESETFKSIQKYNLDKIVELNENEYIEIALDKIYKYLFIVMIIGTHSGIITINEEKYNTWDIYCHFNRTVTRKYCINNKNIKIVQSSSIIDTSKCKRDINFTKYKKQLIIKEIYFC